MKGVLIVVFLLLVVGIVGGLFWLLAVRSSLREAKNYERGLKMVPMLIHLPPASEDINKEGNTRDQRDLTDEVLSQAQAMYNIISSTAVKGFKSKLYGQRHMSFEIVARDGLVYYYVVVPTVLADVVKQAVIAAYATARLEEVSEHTVFSKVGKMSGTIGGEFTLRNHFSLPIATYAESKRDAYRAILNAISAAGKEDGVGVQFLIRPAKEGWTTESLKRTDKIKKDRASGKSSAGHGFMSMRDIMEAPWKPPQSSDDKKEDTSKSVERQLTNVEQKEIEAIEEKTRYPGFEVLIRVVVSSNTFGRSQTLMNSIVSAFALFDSPSMNGFKFTVTKNIDELVTAYIFRFFPQAITSNILNSVELATIFHLPDQKSIPTSQVKRQMSKQVDGPTDLMEKGLLIGYNEFRGTKKPIRISDTDRRRHIHVIGQTGVGKSVLQENLAYQDMMDGRGFAFIDPHGDSVEALLSKVPKERVEDVVYFNPSDIDNPIGLNMFEFDHPDQKDFLVQEAISMLYGLYDPGHTGIVGPRLEHIFRNCALLLMSDPQGGTFIDVPKLLIDPDFMKSKLKYVTDQQVLDFWTKEFPASQRSNEAGEVISWVVSKFGPFISNDAMRNIIGQTKSGLKIEDILNNKKILLVNLSKGKMGDLNSKLIGIIFVMKFQAAAMARAKMREEDRQDFTLYVDEFQNFATDSFETILSEARKYRLSVVLGNQFMTQLKEELREAIIGNVGTTITGRIGITDAEIMVKRYQPVFDAEDLTKLPNYQFVSVAQINGMPSAPFSMSGVPPLGQPNQQLSDALKRLSAAKYARPRAEVEKEIFARIAPPKPTPSALSKPGSSQFGGGVPKSGSSFLDEWLEKRKQLGGGAKPPTVGMVSPPASSSVPPLPANAAIPPPKPTQQQPSASVMEVVAAPLKISQPPAPLPSASTSKEPVVTTLPDAAPEEAEQALEKEAADDHLQLRGPKAHEQNNEISLKLR
ncbi:MAG TPA: TraM recognition domain-containing protein [Candidatus Saccharibacteria bacterium]|nr:TraM recognition domain-containing protein [Candidatus Saccharibacteria bacterium]HMR38467.1 TraM recognition domain-containing protein [Candidatus Saccharibacteria bacterium]